MTGSFLIFIIAVGAVTLAEMGDKTQLLAMAFATKYEAWKVLVGVLIATVLNHALAVALGTFISRNETIGMWVKIIAALSFIVFGLWTLRGDTLDGEDKKMTKYGAIVTVGIAFFIAELGDKTQLATIALAVKYPYNPFAILLGTTTGMLIADGIGIIIGVVLCKKIPERTIKLVSAGAFILFGFWGLYDVLVTDVGMARILIMGILATIFVLTLISSISLLKNETSLKKPAR